MKTGLIIGIVVIVAILLVGGFFVFSGNKNTTNTGSSNNPPSSLNVPPSTAQHKDLVGVISNNHGHSVILTKSEQDAGQAATLELTTGAGHTHTLSLSATQVKNAADGTKVEATSSVVSGHSHVVKFN